MSDNTTKRISLPLATYNALLGLADETIRRSKSSGEIAVDSIESLLTYKSEMSKQSVVRFSEEDEKRLKLFRGLDLLPEDNNETLSELISFFVANKKEELAQKIQEM